MKTLKNSIVLTVVFTLLALAIAFAVNSPMVIGQDGIVDKVLNNQSSADEKIDAAGAGTVDFLQVNIIKITETPTTKDFDDPVTSNSVSVYVKVGYGDKYKTSIETTANQPAIDMALKKVGGNAINPTEITYNDVPPYYNYNQVGFEQLTPTTHGTTVNYFRVYKFTWNTSGLSDGNYEVKAIAKVNNTVYNTKIAEIRHTPIYSVNLEIDDLSEADEENPGVVIYPYSTDKGVITGIDSIPSNTGTLRLTVDGGLEIFRNETSLGTSVNFNLANGLPSVAGLKILFTGIDDGEPSTANRDKSAILSYIDSQGQVKDTDTVNFTVVSVTFDEESYRAKIMSDTSITATVTPASYQNQLTLFVADPDILDIISNTGNQMEVRGLVEAQGVTTQVQAKLNNITAATADVTVNVLPTAKIVSPKNGSIASVDQILHVEVVASDKEPSNSTAGGITYIEIKANDEIIFTQVIPPTKNPYPFTTVKEVSDNDGDYIIFTMKVIDDDGDYIVTNFHEENFALNQYSYSLSSATNDSLPFQKLAVQEGREPIFASAVRISIREKNIVVYNPYQGGDWRGFYLGQLHAHTKYDEDKSMDELVYNAGPANKVAKLYKNAGFDFVNIVEHNIVPKIENTMDDFFVSAGVEFTPKFGEGGYEALHTHILGVCLDDISPQKISDSFKEAGEDIEAITQIDTDWINKLHNNLKGLAFIPHPSPNKVAHVELKNILNKDHKVLSNLNYDAICIYNAATPNNREKDYATWWDETKRYALQGMIHRLPFVYAEDDYTPRLSEGITLLKTLVGIYDKFHGTTGVLIMRELEKEVLTSQKIKESLRKGRYWTVIGYDYGFVDLPQFTIWDDGENIKLVELKGIFDGEITIDHRVSWFYSSDEEPDLEKPDLVHSIDNEGRNVHSFNYKQAFSKDDVSRLAAINFIISIKYLVPDMNMTFDPLSGTTRYVASTNRRVCTLQSNNIAFYPTVVDDKNSAVNIQRLDVAENTVKSLKIKNNHEENYLIVNKVLPHNYPEILPPNNFFGHIYDVSSLTGECPDNAYLNFPVNLLDDKGFGKQNLSIAFFNSEISDWEIIESYIDLDHDIIYADIEHLGIYTITAINVEDIEPPVISWEGYMVNEGSIVNSIDYIAVDAKDNVGVAGVKFYLDDMLIAHKTSVGTGWRIKYDFSKIPQKEYEIRAIAYDIAGNEASITRSLYVESSVILHDINIDSIIYVNRSNFFINGHIVPGTIEHDKYINVFINDTYLGDALINSDMTWSFKAFDLQGEHSLKDGDLIVVLSKNTSDINVSDNKSIVLPFDELVLTSNKYEIELGDTVDINVHSLKENVGSYKFESSCDNGLTWSLIQDYSNEEECCWMPLIPVEYLIKVSMDSNVGISNQIRITVHDTLQGVNLTAKQNSPKTMGDGAVIFVAESIGGFQVEYEFGIYNNELEHEIIQDYSNNNIFCWTASEPGGYTIFVNARTSDTEYNIFSDEVLFTINDTEFLAPLESVELIADKLTVDVKEKISFTALTDSGTCLEYKYSINDGNDWVVLNDYNQFDRVPEKCFWYPQNSGIYEVKVEVKEKDSVNIVEDIIEITVLEKSALSGVILNTSSIAPYSVMSEIELIATPTGGGDLYYLFEVFYDDEWVTVRTYNKNNIAYWKPMFIGEYTVRVTVCEPEAWRDSNVAKFTSEIQFVINDASDIKELFVYCDENSPQITGTTIDFISMTIGGQDVLYKYLISSDYGRNYETLQDFSVNKNYSWTPNTAGVYTIQIIAKDFSGEEIKRTIDFCIGIELNSEPL